MENTSYVGLSQQMVLQRQLDIVANNIANADTPGFKVEALMTSQETGRAARNASLNASTQFVLDNGVARDFRSGEIRQTGRTFDMAIDGDAFFAVGSGADVRYTKDGRFTLDPTGTLVTADGQPVQDEGGGQIQIDKEKGEPSVSPDGIVTQDGDRVAKLSVVRFPSLSALSKDGQGLYVNSSNQTPAPAADVRVRQGMVEGSNVNTVVEITNMIQITRAYERTAQMMDSNNELSRTAVDRLAKVS